VLFGEDLDVGELDRVGHQQTEGGDEEGGDLALADAGAGHVHTEPVHGQVATVAEGDGGVEGGAVFGHGVRLSRERNVPTPALAGLTDFPGSLFVTFGHFGPLPPVNPKHDFGE
jgi:hypothetical protein